MKMQKVKKSLEWHYIRWCGVISVCVVKLWLRLTRSNKYTVTIQPIDHKQPTIIASNHQTLLDSPAVFTGLSLRQLIQVSPVKFMTWHKYYNSKYKFPLYSTGCYPTHGEGKTGVRGAVHFAKSGYRSFIYPEGTRTQPDKRSAAYRGVSDILRQLPEARLLLIHIDWENRRKLFSRPKLSITLSDAPDNLDRSNPDAIMDAIYGL